MLENIRKSFDDALNLLNKTISEENLLQILKIANLISEIFRQGNKVLICGNGGSNCDAMHFAEEFTGRYRNNRKALPVMAISDSSHITCVGNDYGFEFIFSRGIEAYGKENDVFIVLSTSGNSQNIIEAVSAAKHKKLKTIAFLGKDGGKLKGECDFEFIIEEKTSDRIQEIHMLILHILIEVVERILFPENYEN